MRLVDGAEVANWVTGRLEVFFEGSWSQVCSAEFDSADADVACRQLGYGAGAVAGDPVNANTVFNGLANATKGVLPEAAITLSGCKGDEASLLDCPAEKGGLNPLIRGCTGETSLGLKLACVAMQETGPHHPLAADARAAVAAFACPHRDGFFAAAQPTPGLHGGDLSTSLRYMHAADVCEVDNMMDTVPALLAPCLAQFSCVWLRLVRCRYGTANGNANVNVSAMNNVWWCLMWRISS